MEAVFIALDTVCTLLAAGGFAMIALTHREQQPARIAIIGAGLLLLGRWTMWSFMTETPWWSRGIVGAVFGGMLLAGLPALLQWSREREQTHNPPHAVTGTESAPATTVPAPLTPPKALPLPPPATPEPSIPKVPAKSPRIFVDSHVTPEFLMGLYEGNTTLRAETLISEQIGRWMSVSGPLGEIHPGWIIGTFPRTPTMVVFASNSKPTVYMWFLAEWVERLASLATNQNITVLGQIKKVTLYNTTVELENCELVILIPNK